MSPTLSATEPTAIEAKAVEPVKRPPSNVLPVNLDLLGIDTIKRELQKLAATNQEILKAFQNRAELPPAKPKDFGSSGNILLPAEADELAKAKKEAEKFRKENEQFRRACEQLRKQNEELRKRDELLRGNIDELASQNGELRAQVSEADDRIAEMEARLAEAQRQSEADLPTQWQEQQQEFDQLLEEKSDAIRQLHMRIQELEEALRGGPSGPSREQLDERQAALEQLEQRLLADEESLNGQAREMEMSMAKERAELARQRAELQRLHTDVQREIEIAGRDPGLRDRLATLQRRDGRPKTANSLPDINLGNAPPARPARPTTMAAIDIDAHPDDPNAHKGGLFRRLFGG